MPNITFQQAIKPLYDANSRNLQYFDLSDDVTLPFGQFFHIPKGGQLTYQQQYDKGQTHTSRLEAPWPQPDGTGDINQVLAMMNAGRLYDDVPRNREIWELPDSGNEALNNTYQVWTQGGVSQPMSKGWWPNGPFNEQQARAKGQSVGMPSYAWHIGEASENTEWAISAWPMWGWLYNEVVKRYKANYDSRGIPWMICHDYLTLGLPSTFYLGYNKTRQQNKDLFNTPLASWPFTQWSPGGQLAETTGITVTVYPGTPWERPRVLSTMYQLECYKKIGKKGVVVCSSRSEWRPNNQEAIFFPDGKVYRSDKVSVDPSEAITYGCMTFIHGDGFVNWGGATKSKPSEVKNTLNIPYGLSLGQTSDYWKANGSNSYQNGAFPRYQYNGSNGAYSGVEDFFAFGMNMYCKTWALTKGGTRAWLKYRTRPVGGTWSAFITPSQTGMDEMIDGYYDYRGIMYSETKNGLMSFYWLNQDAGGIKYEVEFVNPTNPNISYNGFVCGNQIHVGQVNV